MKRWPRKIRERLIAWRGVAYAMRAVFRILGRGHGFWRSILLRRAVDAKGEPLPWLTYPAIEFLVQFDYREMSVFEFGGGQSTLFWAKRAGRVVTVESDPTWCARVRELAGTAAEVHLATDPSDYVRLLSESSDCHDVIVIDGIARRECCEVAPSRLKSGGFVVLDNAERYPDCTATLRASGLLQVDMSGFGPANDYTWVTSFFFRRDFEFPYRDGGRPVIGIGGISFPGAITPSR